MNQQQFNPGQVCRAYTDNQWKQKEDWYVQQVQGINIPPNPLPSDIANVANQIENTLSIARLDMAFVEQSYTNFQLKVKVQEAILYNTLNVNSTTKLTVAEREGLVKEYLNKTPWDGGQYTLYQLREKSDSRYIFMKGVIASLIDKKDLLITHSSAIKAEASLNSMSSSVPNQQKGHTNGV